VDFYHEDDPIDAKVFNRDVAAMLWRYIVRHKNHLYASLGLVVVLTVITLTVPMLIKNLIDRHIVKQGSIAVIGKEWGKSARDQFIKNRLAKGIRLSDSSYFVMASQLSYLSGRDLRDLTARKAMLPEKFTLIEAPAMTEPIAAKLRLALSQGQAIQASPGTFLISSQGLGTFNVNELIKLRSSDLRHFGVFFIFILGIYSLQFLASYWQIISLLKLSQNAMRDLRRDLFAHILSLELSFFDRNPIGKLVNRITNDIEALNEMFSSVLITFFQDILILSGITIVMFSSNIILGLTVAATYPLLVVITLLFRRQARKAYRIIRTKVAAINSFLNESISGIRIIQIFVQEAKQTKKFNIINEQLFNANMKQVYVYGIFRPLIEMFKWIAIAAIIYIGAHLITHGMISYGLIVMFLFYIGTFFEPLGDLAEKFDTLQSATAAGEKILTVFNTPALKEISVAHPIDNIVPSGPGKHVGPVKPPDGEIRFDDVWFAYNPGEWVLKGISFSLKKNHTLAIVGETGSGKTTIASLLTRLYTPQKGRISIGGVPIADIPYHDLRRAIGVVMQDVFLFSRSVADNITLNSDFDNKAFDSACTLSHSDRFIKGLSKGAHEMVMERGATFSAGERQLLAIARTLYFNPSILILDEATSNIDTETERLIQDATRHLLLNRTSLIIAHRLSTIRSADEIIVLEKGNIAEQGNHESLLAHKGIYHNLFTLQFEGV
jgi:ATP-binding cassette, subfamily B, multidrug efflux pump